jgi:hypothetical protein
MMMNAKGFAKYKVALKRERVLIIWYSRLDARFIERYIELLEILK